MLKRLIPGPIKRSVKNLLGVAEVREELTAMWKRIDQLEARLYESREATSERSKTRWRGAAPTTGLTWGRAVDGDAFITRVASYRVFGDDKAVLEIGPGYGRLPRALLKLGISMRRYVGFDLSEQNVKYLRETFVDPRISFIHGDAELAVPEGGFDLAISSLVFKHIFPSFERALANIASRLNVGGLACFDLIEGDTRYFEEDQVTYIRHYSRPEISAILERCGLTLVAFDEVAHDAEHRRLLVVARK